MSTDLSMKDIKVMEFIWEYKGLEEILGEMEESKGQWQHNGCYCGLCWDESDEQSLLHLVCTFSPWEPLEAVNGDRTGSLEFHPDWGVKRQKGMW